ncbi:MAG: signal recognition particle-docking protein FtsY [Gammaproteobacteria bacterium]|nr:signal recognition particle-docking protein FtsY [Gammaproteobacteria bacterium]
MFGFGKHDKSRDKPVEQETSTATTPAADEPFNPLNITAPAAVIAEPFNPCNITAPVSDQTEGTEPIDLTEKLAKTRRGFGDGMADFVLGKKELDSKMLDELETTLLSADVGIEASSEIIDSLQSQITRKAFKNVDALQIALSDIMTELLEPCEQALNIDGMHKPYVILVVGINGAGKTTSIGKLAHHFQQQGKSVLLAAGDTFRAAAVEQLKEWGSRNDVPVIAQGTGADPASVIFDAIESASSKNIDVVIADTAGRLHTQDNLMEELKKIKRVMGKFDQSAPHETLLIMDAGFGQNGLQQALQFHEAMNLTGLAITKLDGTAKGGILFAIANKLKLPIRFIGVGEGIEDLRPFHAKEFVEALLE